MKRMNEVFELPVSSLPIINHSTAQVNAAVRAINHVDKLADALEESLAMLFIAYNLHYGTGINDPVIARLRAVLGDYRGEK